MGFDGGGCHNSISMYKNPHLRMFTDERERERGREREGH